MSHKFMINNNLYIAHRRASLRCDAWAAKAVRYREAGERRKAEHAESRTYQYLTRMKRLADRWLESSEREAPTLQ